MDPETLNEGADGQAAPEATIVEPVATEQPAKSESSDPRQAALQRIIDARSEELRRDSGVQEEPRPSDGAAGEAEESAGPTPEGKETAPASPTNDQAAPEADASRKWKLTINGADREVTERELIAAAQRQYAGEDKLRQAAALRQGDAPKAPTPTPTPGAQPDPQASAPSPSAAKEPAPEKLKDWAKAFAFGDEEQIASAIKDVAGAFNQPVDTSPQDLAGMVNRAIQFSRFQDAHRAAEAKVGSEYEEVRKDPILYDAARKIATREAGLALVNLGFYTVDQVASVDPSVWWQRLTEAHMAGWPVDLEAIYRTGAKEAAEKYGSRPAPEPQSAPVSSLAARRDAKGASIQPPRPANAAATPPPPQAETPADKVARMKKARGL